MKLVINQLLNQNVHLGNSSKQIESIYLLGTIKKKPIFDLEITVNYLRRLISSLQIMSKEKEKILFLSNNNTNSKILEHLAKKINQPVLCTRWIGGQITNNLYTKKTLIPNVVFVCQNNINNIIVREIQQNKIPIVGITSNGKQFKDLTYFVPGNVSSPSSLYIYANVLYTALNDTNALKVTQFVSKKQYL